MLGTLRAGAGALAAGRPRDLFPPSLALALCLPCAGRPPLKWLQVPLGQLSSLGITLGLKAGADCSAGHDVMAVCRGSLKNQETSSAEIYSELADSAPWSHCLGGSSLCFLSLKEQGFIFFMGCGWFLPGCSSVLADFSRGMPPSMPLEMLLPALSRASCIATSGL